VEAKCCRCGTVIVHRNSAPAIRKICWRCFRLMGGR
jgi:hypothetical protein